MANFMPTLPNAASGINTNIEKTSMDRNAFKNGQTMMETSLMPVLVKQAAIGGEGGRVKERGLSIMVNRMCC